MHIMLDLETWGKTPGSDIRSIGAVVFDPVAGWPEYGYLDSQYQFYVATENAISFARWKELGQPATYNGLRYPLARDPETVAWWNDQSPEAQAAFANPVDGCIRFANWLNDLTAEPTPADDQNLRLWANDPHFDASILEAVYRAVGLPVPWHYRAPRSVRTICDLAGMTRDDYCNYGEAHNALDDAIAQAMTVCEAYKRLGLRR
ncbi:3'-5' exoribonuclease [Mesorhizobium sp. M1A.F.Ca.ET.072.01.1.1]|uniref:3'-5' exonuclease n=1 Tax=Mesorhizobium sp. M1A.F.Ca.ET.072.01.1.1 TaxID=2496753 RepID=UPI000FD49875|nr:3'-5' exonuclease [Mesorhizobium sp. M1A.F.Ca.ET.072.01.1.1]RUW55628.1 3'-5' exoribonuclease [Mesorhizobium sp. M1A.F.Ca.ET.072.01.1.1]